MIKLSTYQTKIYNGLRQISESIAELYLDATKLIDSSYQLSSKANLIAHLAREIDSGLRDAFVLQSNNNKEEDNCKQELIKESHRKSILKAIGTDDPNNKLAKSWHKIARNFHRFAHRGKLSEPLREPKQMIEFWAQYEEVLMVFIGSFYSLSNRLDTFIKNVPPKAEQYLIFQNLLNSKNGKFYFFQNLDNVLWLDTLIEKGIFEIKNAPTEDENGILEEWYPIRYLVNIASLSDVQTETKIINIVESVMNAYNEEVLNLHSFTITNLIEVNIQLKQYSFSNILKEFLIKLHLKNDRSVWSLYNYNLLEKLPEKLLINSDDKGIISLLDYAFGFFIDEVLGIAFEGVKFPTEKIVKPFVEDFILSEFIEHYAQKIIEFIGTNAIFICIEKIKTISKINQINFSTFEIASIELTSQTHYSDAWQSNLINFIRDSPTYLSKNDTQTLVIGLINSDLKILQRLGVYIVRVNYENLQAYWWVYIAKHSIDDIVTHEPYILIKEHSKEFNEEEIKKIIAWIENINERYFDAENYSAEEHRQYEIRKWLQAFDKQIIESNTFLNEKFKYYNQVNNWKIEHPEFDSYSTFTVGHQYPVSIDDFEKLSIHEQLSYLNKFKSDYTYNYTEEGLAELLRICVVKNPDNYLLNLNQFSLLPSVYVNELIEGITVSIRNNKIINYKPVLNFVKQKIAADNFINEVKNQRNYKRWLVASLCCLFEAFVDAKTSFDFEEIDLLEIQLIILNLLNNDEFKDDDDKITHDYTMHIMNSIQGKLLEALLKVTALCVEKFVENDASKKWNLVVEDYFTKRLTRTSNSDKDFSIVLGVYISWLIYFDKDWVYSNANKIYDQTYSQQYKYTLYGSFSPMFQKSKGLYNFFIANGIFQKAIKEFTIKGKELEALSTYALWEWVDLKIGLDNNQGILFQIFKTQNFEQFESVILTSRKNKILAVPDVKLFVEHILNIIDDNDKLEQLRGDLLWLLEDIKFFDDDLFKLADKVLNKKIYKSQMIYFFLRHILKIGDSNLALSGKIIEKIVQQELYHGNVENDLKQFVIKLYDSGNKTLADSICISVSEKGSLGLKEIYNQHN